MKVKKLRRLLDVLDDDDEVYVSIQVEKETPYGFNIAQSKQQKIQNVEMQKDKVVFRGQK